MPSDPLSRSLIEITRDLRERRASARDLVEAAIARHEPLPCSERHSHRSAMDNGRTFLATCRQGLQRHYPAD